MNLSTIITLIICIVIILVVIKSLVHKYKKGQLFCDGSCQGCGSYSLCQSSQSILKKYKEEKGDAS